MLEVVLEGCCGTVGAACALAWPKTFDMMFPNTLIAVALLLDAASCKRSVFTARAGRWRDASSSHSKLLGAEGIAAPHVTRFQTRREPAGALGRGAVGKGIGYDIALGLALQAIVSNG